MADKQSAFHVLGLEDAHELDVKADIVDRIAAIIRARRLTQTAAGELMGLDQAEVSKMLRGHLDRFTVDRLIKVLASLGERVHLSFEPIGSIMEPKEPSSSEVVNVTRPAARATATRKVSEAPASATAKAPSHGKSSSAKSGQPTKK